MSYKSKFKGAEIDARLKKMLNVTWAELVALRDEGKLIAGQMYRMTDYETTCTWEDTQVAGHPFDLVLTALDNKTLDEKCSAIWSARDTDGYFANSNLAAWDVRYCLDNDTERFDWAQMGGTTLRLTAFDEEFEAMRLGTIELGGVTYYSWLAYYEGEPAFGVLTKSENPSIGDEAYASMDGETIDGTAEVIGLYEKKGGTGVIYQLVDESENSVPYDFKNIMFKRPLTEGQLDAENGVDTFCYTFSCIDWDTFDISDQSVEEPDYCYGNTFGRWSINNVFLTFSGDNCYFNTFGHSCDNNTFGNNCDNNTFGNNCYFNTFGNSCYKNTFGHSCDNNTFGDNCYFNTFGNSCYFNTFGHSCDNNTFGDNCNSNGFGDDCNYNTFGHGCDSNGFTLRGSLNPLGNQLNGCHHNYFEDGVSRILLWIWETSEETEIQYVKVTKGVGMNNSSYQGVIVDAQANAPQVVVNLKDRTTKVFYYDDIINA